MKPLKIALIGAGYINDYHARALQTLPGVAIVAVASKRLESAEQFAAKYNIPKATTNIPALVQQPEIDAVVISTPNKFHAPYAQAFLAAGKDVLLEKPMAMNPEEGEALIKTAKQYGRIGLVGHMWRYDAEVQFVKNLIDSDALGKIVKTKGYGIHENWGPEGWFTDKDLAGGGALADMGVHAIDTVRFLLGDPLATTVYAKIGTHYGDYEVDDTGIIMISWDNGSHSIIESGWRQPHMDGPEACTQLFGTKGYASVLPTLVKFKDKEQTNALQIPDFKKSEHCDQKIYDAQMVDFINCIRTSTQPKASFEIGQEVLRIVAAAYRSSASGEVVKM